MTPEYRYEKFGAGTDVVYIVSRGGRLLGSVFRNPQPHGPASGWVWDPNLQAFPAGGTARTRRLAADQLRRAHEPAPVPPPAPIPLVTHTVWTALRTGGHPPSLAQLPRCPADAWKRHASVNGVECAVVGDTVLMRATAGGRTYADAFALANGRLDHAIRAYAHNKLKSEDP